MEEGETGELLVVDDDRTLRAWAMDVLGGSGYTCEGAAFEADARARLRSGSHALVLLAVGTPGGLELLANIRCEHPATAIVMLTGADHRSLALEAIEQGAYGYLVRPVSSGELLTGVAGALYRRRQERESQRLVERLGYEIVERNARLADALHDLQESQLKMSVARGQTIFRLARLAEFRDQQIGGHLRRMSAYCDVLAAYAGRPGPQRELLRQASQLHDVGNVDISEEILGKRGKLSRAERAIVETHTEIGYEMLEGAISDVVKLGAVIAQTHHERWDGSGYPRGLAREQIPLEGRIAAIADVFDALTQPRCHRPAFPAQAAVEKMRGGRGVHFDPQLLDAFIAALPEIETVRRAHTT